MIRMRRLPPTRFRRPQYEVELISDGKSEPVWRRVTRAPVTLIDPKLGVGDAWALVHAADDAWDGEVGEWVSLFGGPTP
jgi:hypothetical protein